MLFRVLRIAVLGVLATADIATAQEHFEFWSFLDHGRPITRCAENSVAHKSATARLNQLEELFDRLKPSDDGAAREALHALLKTECFLFSSEIQDVPSPDSAASAKDWGDTRLTRALRPLQSDQGRFVQWKAVSGERE